MIRKALIMLAMVALAVPAATAVPPTPQPTQTPDKVVYQPRKRDAVLKEMEAADKARDKAAEEATAKIREAQKAKREKEKESAKVLRFDMSKIVKPASPAAFKQAWHFPPVAQYLTGTCWSFSTTSFYESEIYRLTGQKIKLSEMYTVYWEYVEKMRRFVQQRGDSFVSEGSEGNALPRIWKQYGIVPESAYTGLLGKAKRYDHSRLIERLQELAGWAKKNDIWDENLILEMTRDILDSEMGAPPTQVTWKGKIYTPQQFLKDVTGLNMNDYVEVMSTLSIPFYTQGEYKVPDNWWHDASYYNVPLDEWYGAMKKAVQEGYTVAIGGDVSEPGYNGEEDAAVIPSFDIPQAYINQDSREFRFANKTSTDDHGIHLVGWTTAGGHDWFLIKDSARSSRHGKFPGYFFYRDDYVKLKMLTYTINKNAIKDLLAKFKK